VKVLIKFIKKNAFDVRRVHELSTRLWYAWPVLSARSWRSLRWRRFSTSVILYADGTLSAL